MSELIVQPSIIDNYLYQLGSTINYGNLTYIAVGPYVSNNTTRTIIKFDFSSLPADAIISAAELDLYYYAKGANPVGRTYWAYELTQTGWVELQSTWDIYKTGNNWAAAGGDYVTGNGASLAVPASYGWMSWNVLALVQHFQSVHAQVGHFLIKDGTEDGSGSMAFFYSRDYTTDPSLCPKLIITYTAPTNYPRAVAGAVGWVGGTVKRLASAKRKITGAIYDSLRTQKDILENLIPDPHRAVKNMESLSQAFKGGQGWELCPRYSR